MWQRGGQLLFDRISIEYTSTFECLHRHAPHCISAINDLELVICHQSIYVGVLDSTKYHSTAGRLQASISTTGANFGGKSAHSHRYLCGSAKLRHPPGYALEQKQ
jgi:hypothetical protein